MEREGGVKYDSAGLWPPVSRALPLAFTHTHSRPCWDREVTVKLPSNIDFNEHPSPRLKPEREMKGVNSSLHGLPDINRAHMWGLSVP